MARVHSHRHRYWSKLQKEILTLIFERISDLSDLQACLAVCSSWRSAVATTVCGGCRIAATPLLLILPPTPNHPQYHKQKEEKEEEELLSKVFAFGENNPLIREFCISTPIQFMNTNCAIFGSHRGWLLMHYDPPTSTPHAEVSVYHSLLYNPVTRVHVKLPPPPPGGGKLFRRGVTLFTSTTPTDPNCVVVVMFQDQLRVPNRNYHALLVSCKPAAAAAGDWSIIKRTNHDPYHDMFFCKDAEELYAVDMNGELFLFDFKESRVVEEKVVVENSGIVETRYVPNNFCIHHLVELESGEVLMVQRLVKFEFTGGEPTTMKTLSFRFFKLKWRSKSRRTAEWEEERSCFCSSTGTHNRNQTLLLEYGDSMFVSNTEYKPNCIYFIDGWQHAGSFNYFKVYDLENHTITQHLIHHLNPSFTHLDKGFYCRWFRTSNI